MSESPGARTARHHRVLHQFADRTGWLCTYCDEPLRCFACDHGSGRLASMDHIVPRAHGGTRQRRNLAVVCTICNTAKGSREATQQQRIRAKAARSERWTERYAMCRAAGVSA